MSITLPETFLQLETALGTILKDVQNAIIIFSDLSGSTRESVEDFREYIKKCLVHMHVAGQELSNGSDRKVVKTIGDEVMVTQIPVNGSNVTDLLKNVLSACIRFQNKLEKARIKAKIGIHYCKGVVSSKLIETNLYETKVPVNEGDIFGKDVNLAARIMTVAQAGHVLVSELVYSYIKDNFTFNTPLRFRFRGFDEDIKVYEVKYYDDELNICPLLKSAYTFKCLTLFELDNLEDESIQEFKEKITTADCFYKENILLFFKKRFVHPNVRNTNFVGIVFHCWNYEFYKERLRNFKNILQMKRTMTNPIWEDKFWDQKIIHDGNYQEGTLYLFCCLNHKNSEQLFADAGKNLEILFNVMLLGHYDNCIITNKCEKNDCSRIIGNFSRFRRNVTDDDPDAIGISIEYGYIK